LAAAALIFLLVCVVMSIVLAEGISRPIRTAGRAARAIAAFYANGSTHGTLNVRIPENHTTAELTGLSQSINVLGRELAEGERRQKQLMNDIAHELRTPLTCLRGALEAVADGVWEASPERLENCLDEVRRLSKMLDDIMLLTRLEWENITLHKTHFDVSALLKNAAERFMCTAAEKGIVLTTQTIPAVVYADHDRIMQVIVNLLSNAVRYTDTGRITLTIEPSELNAEEGGEPPSLQPYGLSLPPMRGAADATKRACRPPSIQRGDTSLPEAPRNAPANSSPIAIKVADTGCGIDAADLPRIFERFYRADKSRNRNSGGLGVGLSIAAAIAAAHGWELSAESKSGEGSVFTIIAPQGGEQFYSR
jgi:signal transduction histidine kinase